MSGIYRYVPAQKDPVSTPFTVQKLTPFKTTSPHRHGQDRTETCLGLTTTYKTWVPLEKKTSSHNLNTSPSPQPPWQRARCQAPLRSRTHTRTRRTSTTNRPRWTASTSAPNKTIKMQYPPTRPWEAHLSSPDTARRAYFPEEPAKLIETYSAPRRAPTALSSTANDNINSPAYDGGKDRDPTAHRGACQSFRN